MKPVSRKILMFMCMFTLMLAMGTTALATTTTEAATEPTTQAATLEETEAATTESEETATEPAATEPEATEPAESSGNPAKSRYLITGAIVLAVGGGFYAYLTIKTKRPNRKKK